MSEFRSAWNQRVRAQVTPDQLGRIYLRIDGMFGTLGIRHAHNDLAGED